MAAESLSEEMIKDGKAILRIAEATGLYPVAAAWVMDHEMGDWRYYLATPLVNLVGRTKIYDVLSVALRACLGNQGWVFLRMRFPPMATRIMALETSMRRS